MEQEDRTICKNQHQTYQIYNENTHKYNYMPHNQTKRVYTKKNKVNHQNYQNPKPTSALKEGDWLALDVWLRGGGADFFAIGRLLPFIKKNMYYIWTSAYYVQGTVTTKSFISYPLTLPWIRIYPIPQNL